jgi:predicted nucleotidyltransferase
VLTFRRRIIIIFDRFMTVQDLYREDVRQLCAVHKVKALYAFGSVLTSAFNDQSDVDLVVDFEPIDVDNYADNYFDLKFSLQDILKRKIDLLEEKAIRNPYLKQAINNSRKLVYEH